MGCKPQGTRALREYAAIYMAIFLLPELLKPATVLTFTKMRDEILCPCGF